MSEKPAPVTDKDVLAFVGASIGSVWELELLLLLRAKPERSWTPAELERELRASATVVNFALRRLSAAGIVVDVAPGQLQYRPPSPRLHEVLVALERAYRTNPVSVIKAILGAPETKLKIFSDAFRFKE